MSAALTNSTDVASSPDGVSRGQLAIGRSSYSVGGLDRLVWRELRYLGWWTAATLALTVFLQLSSGQLFAGNSTEYFQYRVFVYEQAFVAPLVFLLGVLAASFASERSDASFQWVTGLPVAWPLALGVKTACALSGALICLAFAIGSATVIGMMIPVPADENAVREFQSISRAVWPLLREGGYYFCLLSFVLFPLALWVVLLVRHPANGLIAAVVSVFVGLTAWTSVLESRALVRQAGVDLSSAAAWEFWTSVMVGGLLWVAASYCYRWRWSTGMFSQWPASWAKRSAVGMPVNDWGAWVSSDRPPRVAACLGWLSRRQLGLIGCLPLMSLGLLLTGVLFPRQEFFLGSWVFRGQMIGMLGCVGLVGSAGWSGIWAFAGSSRGEDVGFLAERGVSPTKFWLSRYLGFVVSCTLIAVVGAVGLCVNPQNLTSIRFPETASIVIALVLGSHAIGVAGMIAGQSLRSWQLASFSLGITSLFVLYVSPWYLATSGLWGVAFLLGLPSLGLPLSWWLTRRGLIGWRPRLAWVFPSYAVLLIAVGAVSLPVVRVWVLPAPLPELTAERPTPPIRAVSIPASVWRDQWQIRRLFLDPTSVLTRERLRSIDPQFHYTAQVRQEYPQVLSGLKSVLEIAGAVSAAGEIATANRATSQPQEDPFVMLETGAGIKHVIERLGEMGGLALVVGEIETAAEALELRNRLFQDLYPMYGLLDGTNGQALLLERLMALDDETLEKLQQRLPVDEWLPDITAPESRRAWEASLEALFSYAARNPVHLANGRPVRKPRAVPQDPRVVRSDRFFSLYAPQTRWPNFQAVSFFVPFPINEWAVTLESERSLRETSQLYRQWQSYLQTGHLIPASADDPWVGQWSNWDFVTPQIRQRQREEQATQNLRLHLQRLVNVQATAAEEHVLD